MLYCQTPVCSLGSSTCVSTHIVGQHMCKHTSDAELSASNNLSRAYIKGVAGGVVCSFWSSKAKQERMQVQPVGGILPTGFAPSEQPFAIC